MDAPGHPRLAVRAKRSRVEVHTFHVPARTHQALTRTRPCATSRFSGACQLPEGLAASPVTPDGGASTVEGARGRFDEPVRTSDEPGLARLNPGMNTS